MRSWRTRLLLRSPPPHSTPLRGGNVVVLGIAKDSKLFKEKQMVGSLLVGCLKDGKFVAVGRVGSGLTPEQRKALYEALIQFKTHEDENYIYVKPRLVVEVEYQELLPSKEFETGFTWRHPRIIRLRLDKKPTEEDISLQKQFPISLG